MRPPPRSAIARAAACAVAQVPATFTASRRSSSARDVSRNGANVVTPALATAASSPPSSVQGQLHQAVDGRGVGDVARRRQHAAAARRRELGGGPLGERGVDVVQHDVPAVGGQRGAHGAADPGAGAGDQGDAHARRRSAPRARRGPPRAGRRWRRRRTCSRPRCRRSPPAGPPTGACRRAGAGAARARGGGRGSPARGPPPRACRGGPRGRRGRRGPRAARDRRASSTRSPSRSRPIGPPASASGLRWPMHGPVETPEKRPSVSTATSRPQGRSLSAMVIDAISAMPVPMGPTPASTSTSPGRSGAIWPLTARMASTPEPNTRTGPRWW